MKIYRLLLTVLIFFIVIYAFRGYLRPSDYGLVNNSILQTLGVSTNTSSTTADAGLELSASSSPSLLDKIKEIDTKINNYTINRDKLSPVIGNNNSSDVENRLTTDGIFFAANSERVNQSLDVLKRNSVLDISAQIKLNDMFSNQYFEHVSPSGTSVSDVVNGVGYTFLVVGENLALGNFAGDSKVTAAWMASPGHRANILDKRYTEIGVAVGYGMYKGQMQWLAVQHFARPMSSCPSPSAGIKTKIATDKNDLVQREEDITTMKKVVDKTESSDANFTLTVSSYNALVNDYNNRLKNLRTEIANYNEQVKNYNTCLDSVTLATQ